MATASNRHDPGIIEGMRIYVADGSGHTSEGMLDDKWLLTKGEQDEGEMQAHPSSKPATLMLATCRKRRGSKSVKYNYAV